MKSLREWIGNWAFSRLKTIAPPPPNAPTAPATTNPNAKVLLHVGCGHSTLHDIPLSGFQNNHWEEIRLDIDPSVQPDITGTMTDMKAVENAFADAIYSSHNIEHLYPHEVHIALQEFLRVLKPNGFAVITCPDLQSVCALVAEGKLLEEAYTSEVGAIAPLDILYGYRPALAKGKLFMAHRMGFTLSTLMAILKEAGFATIVGACRPEIFDLWVLASKSPRTPEEMQALSKDYLLPNYESPQGD